MGKVISLRTRRNIEMQGFLGLDDLQIAQLDGWLRFSPLVCLAWTATGLWLASPTVIAALVPFALLGGILKRHPFDAVYNYGLRFLAGGPKIPAYGTPRKFGCLMASVMLSLTAAALYAGVPAAGFALGGLMIALASVNVTTGFCVPSYTYSKIFGPVRRTGTVRSAG